MAFSCHLCLQLHLTNQHSRLLRAWRDSGDPKKGIEYLRWEFWRCLPPKKDDMYCRGLPTDIVHKSCFHTYGRDGTGACTENVVLGKLIPQFECPKDGHKSTIASSEKQAVETCTHLLSRLDPSSLGSSHLKCCYKPSSKWPPLAIAALCPQPIPIQSRIKIIKANEWQNQQIQSPFQSSQDGKRTCDSRWWWSVR